MLQALSQMLGGEAGLETLAPIRSIETVASPEVRARTEGMIAMRANHA
jgi:hypothetical protein